MWGQVVDPHALAVCLSGTLVVAAAFGLLMVASTDEALLFAWLVWPLTAYWALRADHGWP